MILYYAKYCAEINCSVFWKASEFWFPVKLVLESYSTVAAGRCFKVGKLQTSRDEVLFGTKSVGKDE